MSSLHGRASMGAHEANTKTRQVIYSTSPKTPRVKVNFSKFRIRFPGSHPVAPHATVQLKKCHCHGVYVWLAWIRYGNTH
jgi:hypothetical protein